MSSDWNRREFVRATAAAGLGTLVTARPASARIVGANDRIRLGAIGTGGRCQYLLQVLNGLPGNEIVALCDVYQPHLLEAAHLAIDGAGLYSDYRRVLDRPDVDAVVIGAPDHWHKHLMIAAVAAGKDVYCEKPMTHAIAEGPEIIHAVAASDRVVQTGTQQRSWPHFLLAAQLIDDGVIGQVTFVHTYWYQSYGWQTPAPRPRQSFDPSLLDTRAWLGSAPPQEVDAEKFRFWRWFWNFGGGNLTDLMTHWIDMVQLYIHQPAPLAATTVANNFLHPQWQCPDTITCALQYPGSVNVTHTGAMQSSIDDGGIEVRGTRGTLKIDRQRLVVYPEGIANLPHSNAPEPEIRMISERDGTVDHMSNFLDCIRSRKRPNAHVQVGLEAARTAHLGNLALHRGRRIEWDAATQSVRA